MMAHVRCDISSSSGQPMLELGRPIGGRGSQKFGALADLDRAPSHAQNFSRFDDFVKAFNTRLLKLCHRRNC